MRKSAVVSLLLAAMLFLSGNAMAAGKKVVLQLSDGNPSKQTRVLNVAINLQKYYGPDDVTVEIVAFGPGLRLLFDDNAKRDRIQSLNANGVRFSACQNTVKGMTRVLGHPPKLNKLAVPVTAGVGRIIELVEQGYILIRP
jgi:intracellular sulfur oxidation DsrE/DsrF family protein